MNQEVIEELRERIARLEAAARPTRPRVYNQQTAARELGMSVSKLQGELKAGRLNGRRSGRIWMFTDADIEAYIAAQADD
jgi:hypothetical protein